MTTDAAEPAEQSVQDAIVGLLAEDADLDSATKDVVLDALGHVAGQTGDAAAAGPAATFLSSISVAGFRGIGPAARLDLYPAPGLMVISGRNGSGKSSFAEALELALTGTSYRWQEKAALWTETWRNLHHRNPCEIRVEFTGEGVGPFTIGLDWGDQDPLEQRRSWIQAPGAKRVDGTEQLHWSRPLELHRPVLSYDELGRVFDVGPTVLHDALARLLGLEVLADTEKWLAAALKDTRGARTRADEDRKRLQTVLAEHTGDERARRAVSLLARQPIAVDDVLALATGGDSPQLAVVSALRAVTELHPPPVEEIGVAADALRAALRQVAAAASAALDLTDHRVSLLQLALRFHDNAGDTDCPVCGQGRLDDDWLAQARQAVTDGREALAQYHSATAELGDVRSAVVGELRDLQPVAPIPGVDLAGLPAYNDAVAAARQIPADDAALAAHLESELTDVAAAAETLRAQAAGELAHREDAWAPLAAQLGGWVQLEQEARAVDDQVKTMAAAKKWLTDHAADFRNRRLTPIAERVRHIWGQLRQESNVGIGEITLEGTANRRHLTIGGFVDGEPTAAISVMSQGELHALALALFLPRATSTTSPFRFVVLDDPIQAMDPAKIDGFLDVLSEIAETHQVVVFSHDDRLATLIRRTGVDARLVEVIRESGSRVTVRDNVNPALRGVGDVFALLKDDSMPEAVKRRVAPGLFRMALEAAARQAFYTKQSLAGEPGTAAEERWESAKKTGTRLALTVHGDATADLTAWLDQKPARRTALGISNRVHGGAAYPISLADAKALEQTVEEVLALR